MQTDQLDMPVNANREYDRACDTAQSLLEWLQRDVLGVHWTCTEVSEETLNCFVNGIEIFCGSGPHNALLQLVGAMDELRVILGKMKR